jgi:hypothetical protein
VTPADQNAFFASLAGNGVKYMISAHDHLYNRALLSSPDGKSQVEQIITIGASTKFYTPAGLNAFPTSVKPRETQISQELLNIGYYIYTVDGPRVMVDYYSDAKGNFMDDADYPYGAASVPARLYMPKFKFVKKQTFGYNTNGQQFLIAQGDSYTDVTDSFGATAAKIVGGTNKSTATDFTPVALSADGTQVSGLRPLNKAVNTGWTDKPKQKCKDGGPLFSDILSLWGMAELGTEQTDEYVLSMKYKFSNPFEALKAGIDALFGKAGIAALDEDGDWVNAVNLNIGTSKRKFVVGPYKSTYKLGTYGIDWKTGEVWAVVDYNADFALADFGPDRDYRRDKDNDKDRDNDRDRR